MIAHGGTDTHRYQIIRYGMWNMTPFTRVGLTVCSHESVHCLTARKMRGRAFAVNYRWVLLRSFYLVDA